MTSADTVVGAVDAALTGGRRRLAVRDEIVALTSDYKPPITDPRPSPPDHGPAALALGAIRGLQLASDMSGSAPLAAVTPRSAMSVLL